MRGVSPFEYNNIVSNDQFIGRKKEVDKVKNLIKNHSNILMYGPPKIGKRSIIYNAFKELKEENIQYKICTINLFNIRYIEDFLHKLVEETVKAFDLEKEFDNKRFNFLLNGIQIGANKTDTYTDKEVKTLLKFPEGVAKIYKAHFIIYLQQFQDILLFDKFQKLLSIFESVLSNSQHVSYIIVGDKRNAMEYIFVEKNYFRNIITNIPINPINKKVFCQYIIDKFEENGKQASIKESAMIYDSMEGDPWYIQHLAEICFFYTTEKLTPQIVEDSIEKLLTIHDYELHNTAYSLSTHQLQLIHAILDGEKKFSKSQILEKYKLNSSANVNRLREALTKKEIVTFLSKNKIEFNDSLLKYWFKKHFFI